MKGYLYMYFIHLSLPSIFCHLIFQFYFTKTCFLAAILARNFAPNDENSLDDILYVFIGLKKIILKYFPVDAVLLKNTHLVAVKPKY